MPRGGARSNSGPPPDPNSGRSARRQGDWTILPFEGYTGEIPEYPFAASDFSDPSPNISAEEEFWRALWRKPQAVMWKHRVETVAMYCRTYVEASKPGAPAAYRTLCRQYEDDLGLSTAMMLKLRWKVAEDALAEKREERAAAAAAPPATSSARSRRMKAVGRNGTSG
jgi:hypothetical protein